MDRQQRADIFMQLQAQEDAMMDTKGREYCASEDTLANFKRNAEQLGLDPLLVWAVYFFKHIDSIRSYIKDPEQPLSEPILGRIVDARTYLGLLACLIEERNQKEALPMGAKVVEAMKG